MHVVAPTEQPASGSPCIAMMRALRRQPRKLVPPLSKPAHARSVVRGLSAAFPVLPRGTPGLGLGIGIGLGLG